jgi:hypothetical protein
VQPLGAEWAEVEGTVGNHDNDDVMQVSRSDAEVRRDCQPEGEFFPGVARDPTPPGLAEFQSDPLLPQIR